MRFCVLYIMYVKYTHVPLFIRYLYYLPNTRENLEDSNRSIHNRRKQWFKMDSYIILCAIIARVVYKYTLCPDSGWKSNIQPQDQRVGSLQTVPPRHSKLTHT